MEFDFEEQDYSINESVKSPDKIERKVKKIIKTLEEDEFISSYDKTKYKKMLEKLLD